MLVFIVPAPVYIHTKSVGVFPFAQVLPVGFSLDVLDGGHSDLCEGTSHGSFNLPGLSS